MCVSPYDVFSSPSVGNGGTIECLSEGYAVVFEFSSSFPFDHVFL